MRGQGYPVRERPPIQRAQPEQGLSDTTNRVAQYGGREYSLLVRSDVDAQLRMMVSPQVTMPMLWQVLELVAIFEAANPGDIVVDTRTVERVRQHIGGTGGVHSLVFVNPQTVRGIIASPERYLGIPCHQAAVREMPVRPVMQVMPVMPVMQVREGVPVREGAPREGAPVREGAFVREMPVARQLYPSFDGRSYEVRKI